VRYSQTEIKKAPSRFRNALSRDSVRRTGRCIRCGTCVEMCPFGVHEIRAGQNLVTSPHPERCLGRSCEDKAFFCVAHCPRGALSMGENLVLETLGDWRWTPQMILATWELAETGFPRQEGPGVEVGASGGGFDKLQFRWERQKPDLESILESDIDVTLRLNRRNQGVQRSIDVPFYGGGMSFGSISLPTMIGKAGGAKNMGTYTCTGEGGYPEALVPYAPWVITQVATGLFGVREETIQMAPIVEFKYAQGAKPGLGGHLLGDKVTRAVAALRETVQGRSLFSPFPFHSVYSVEDHKKHVDWILEINPDALISVKVSTPTDVDMVAVGSYYAGAHIIHLDGGYGGTGAAPEIAKKNIAMPIEYAIPKVHRFLEEEGIREEITVMAGGGVRTAYDAAKAIALGADGVVIGTAELVALECCRCGNCESGRGCPRGIATTDGELSGLMDTEWAIQRITNLYHAWKIQLAEILWRLDLHSVEELRGRRDLLIHEDYAESR
jgi:glutamate synthase domain-containing protein 2/ferredoxin